MDNNRAMREFLKERINKDIVMKYIFVQTMEGQCTGEELREKYGIDIEDIRQKYEELEEAERERVENSIRKQIKAGEVDLSREAVSWQNQTMRMASTKEANGLNQGKREGR